MCLCCCCVAGVTYSCYSHSVGTFLHNTFEHNYKLFLFTSPSISPSIPYIHASYHNRVLHLACCCCTFSCFFSVLSPACPFSSPPTHAVRTTTAHTCLCRVGEVPAPPRTLSTSSILSLTLRPLSSLLLSPAACLSRRSGRQDPSSFSGEELGMYRWTDAKQASTPTT